MIVTAVANLCNQMGFVFNHFDFDDEGFQTKCRIPYLKRDLGNQFLLLLD